jgi:hypothetical protein
MISNGQVREDLSEVNNGEDRTDEAKSFQKKKEAEEVREPKETKKREKRETERQRKLRSLLIFTIQPAHLLCIPSVPQM